MINATEITEIIHSTQKRKRWTAYEAQNEFVSAFQCYKQAAMMGYPLSQLNVAKQYIRGHGTVQDYVEAYAWLTASIAQGLDEGRQPNAEKLKTLLTDEMKNVSKPAIV